MSRQGQELLTLVAVAAADSPMAVWGFGVGGCLTGMVRAGNALHRPDLIAGVRRRVEPALLREPDPTDHLISVETLLVLPAAEMGPRIEESCHRWAQTVLAATRPVPGRPRVHRPDYPPWQDTVWVDCMHTDGPGLAALGYLNEAVAYAEEYADSLQRADGLFHHGYDVGTGRGNDVAWGRGQAWALLGLVGTLEIMDDDGLQRRLDRLLQAMALHENAGRWRTVVDDAAAPVENSVAAYVAWAVPRAVNRGLVDHAYAAMAERAWQATLCALEGGALPCSAATPVGTVDAYHRQPTGVFPWGQAPVLHALIDRLEAQEGPSTR